MYKLGTACLFDICLYYDLNGIGKMKFYNKFLKHTVEKIYPYFFAIGLIVLGFTVLQQTLSLPVSVVWPQKIGGSSLLKSRDLNDDVLTCVHFNFLLGKADTTKRLLLYIEIIPSSEHWSMLVHVVPGTCLQLSSGFGPIRRH